MVALGFLLGNFLATALATSAGQQAELDILAGALLVSLTEGISWLFYRRSRTGQEPLPRSPNAPRSRPARSLVAEILNATKIGLIYGLFIEAFKLGS